MTWNIDMRNPPYVHDRNRQYQRSVGVNHSQDYNEAVINLQYTIQQVEVYYDSTTGGWKYDLNNGEPAVNISDLAYYDAPFTVRAFAVQPDDEGNYMQIIYDTPFSEKVIFKWATGVFIQGSITRLWVGDPAMEQGKIILAR